MLEVIMSGIHNYPFPPPERERGGGAIVIIITVIIIALFQSISKRFTV